MLIHDDQVSKDAAGQRLDRFLSRTFPHIGFAQWQRLARKKELRVNGQRAQADQRLVEGDQVRAFIPQDWVDAKQVHQQAPLTLRPAQRQLLQEALIYEDDSLLILNKPYGLPVQGGSKQAYGLDQLLNAWQQERGQEVVRLTHRLDKDTTGLLVWAKTRRSAQALATAFQKRQVQKTYWALGCGVPEVKEGLIRAPLAKQQGAGTESVTVCEREEGGKAAETGYRCRDVAGRKASWLELTPKQGRTHQVRVHCALLDCPIQGDHKYGQRADFIANLAPKLHLHAVALTLKHPETGKSLSLQAPLPPHMRESWDLLGWPIDVRF